MKKYCFFLGLAGLFASARAQDLPGLSSGNYAVMSGVYSNPANIAGSRYRFDINLFSMEVTAGSDRISYSLGRAGNTFKGDSLKNQLFGNAPGGASVLAVLAIQGPSVMFGIGRKWGFAITTRARVIANVRNLDSKLFQSIDNGGSGDLPYSFSSGGEQVININAWKEIGVSVAREVLHEGPNSLKAGVTLRYLMGVGNAYLMTNGLSGTINQDPVRQQSYLTAASGSMGIGFAGVDFTDFKVDQLTNTNGSGIGADLGIVYRWQHTLRIGVSVLDLGAISYTPEPQSTGGYNIHIGANQRYYLNDLDSVSLTNYKQHLAGYPQYFTSTTDSGNVGYAVSLPTRLQADVDLRLHRGFYVNGSVSVSLVNTSKVYNPTYYNTFTLTPRWEGGALGLYLPMSYNTLTGTNAGVAVRLGPLFLGSATVLSSLLGHSGAANFFMGVHIGGLRHGND